jgi:hypothetical protein
MPQFLGAIGRAFSRLFGPFSPKLCVICREAPPYGRDVMCRDCREGDIR